MTIPLVDNLPHSGQKTTIHVRSTVSGVEQAANSTVGTVNSQEADAPFGFLS